MDGRTDGRWEEKKCRAELSAELRGPFRRPTDVTLCVCLAAGQLRPYATQPGLQGEPPPGRRPAWNQKSCGEGHQRGSPRPCSPPLGSERLRLQSRREAEFQFTSRPVIGPLGA